jgi:PKD repeat protein
MKQLCSTFRRWGLKLAVLALLVLPELASAQLFSFNPYGDVLAGFRKTGANAGNYELVVDVGSVTNLLSLTAGSTINITNFSPSQLTDAFTNYNNLQWSAFTGVPAGGGRNPPPWVTPLGSFPANSIWYTLPGTNVSTQTQPPARATSASQVEQESLMSAVGNGAAAIGGFIGVSNADNNTVLVREPVSYSSDILTAFIGDKNFPTNGDFGAGNAPLPQTVENWTPPSFTSAQRSDFYQVCPLAQTDPITGLTNGSAYFVGYFILNPNGTMTFTRASATPPTPVAGFSGTPTAGFAPLPVLFTDASTGSITNWLWNFGDGQSVTNTSSASVNHTYAAAGSYTVALTVTGPGGSNASTQTGYVVASPRPTIGNVIRSGGNLVFSGTNCPAGVQYRILTSTNVALPVASWQPVATNNFLSNGTFSYTNSTVNPAAFFRLVSP